MAGLAALTMRSEDFKILKCMRKASRIKAWISEQQIWTSSGSNPWESALEGKGAKEDFQKQLSQSISPPTQLEKKQAVTD